VSVPAIEDALERLNAATPSERAQARAEVMRRLDAVFAANPESLALAAENQLAMLSQAATDGEVLRANRSLHALFDLFEKRHWRECRTLIERALLEPRFLMKERYLQALEDFADPASVPALMALLAQPGTSVAANDLRAAVLASLTGYFPPPDDARIALRFLADEHLRTRANALQLVSTHEIRAAGAALVNRIAEERDPDLLAEVLELVERWSPEEALAAINQRLAADDDENEGAREALMSARQALRDKA
jgi:hypothetical protein